MNAKVVLYIVFDKGRCGQFIISGLFKIIKHLKHCVRQVENITY
jgi:hypothetical protein